MIYMWFTGINYYRLAVEKDRDSKGVALKESIVTSPIRIWNVMNNKEHKIFSKPRHLTPCPFLERTETRLKGEKCDFFTKSSIFNNSTIPIIKKIRLF
jgi:hypothetical protein